MKNRLLFINGHLNTGGVEKALIDILRSIDYERYDVDLLLLEELGDYASLLPKQVNVLLRPIQNAYGPLLQCLWRALRNRDWFSFRMRLVVLAVKLFGQEQFSLAGRLLLGCAHYDCAIGFRQGICTVLAAHAADADRSITWWHHGEIGSMQLPFREEARDCDTIAVVSDGCRAMLSREFPELADKMVTIPNMLDVQQIQLRAEEFDPYSDKAVRHIVSVGRLSPEKHFENTVYTAKTLKDRGMPFCWHLVGDGPERPALEALCRELDVTDCFTFEGNQVNPYPYMKHADLFVHPSYVESFGIVVTEALTLGIPCVVTKSTGVMDFLKDGENALLTDQNPDDLTDKVLQVLTDPDLRSRLRNNARCPEQFLPELVMEKIETLLEAGV